jgi:hypothetical protein
MPRSCRCGAEVDDRILKDYMGRVSASMKRLANLTSARGGGRGGGGRGICEYFQKGECTRGDSCRLSHEGGEEGVRESGNGARYKNQLKLFIKFNKLKLQNHYWTEVQYSLLRECRTSAAFIAAGKHTHARTHRTSSDPAYL